MLTAGEILQNRYEIVEPIGKGGMGAVYLTKDTRLGSMVALKETLFQDEALRRAFEREARLLAGLSHPALPRVMDHFTENDGQFLVMEYIAGDDLEALFRAQNGPFAVAEILGWADQLLDALEYLHAQQPPVVHRDIKPQNLKLAARNRIVLLDFGLAKGQAADMTQTSGKSIFGYTAAYAPLEQIRGSGTDPRSDIYSLGATLYHLLTRHAPADAVTRANSVVGAQPDPLTPAHELNPNIPLALAQILQKATALHADQRAQSAAELRKLLKRVGEADAATMLGADPTTPLVAAAAREMPPQFVTTPINLDLSEAATAILPARQDSPPDKDYATRINTAAPVSQPRWKFAAGGVAAASVLGVALWAANSGTQSPATTPNTNVPLTNNANQTLPMVNANTAPLNTNPTPAVKADAPTQAIIDAPKAQATRSEKAAKAQANPPQPATPPRPKEPAPARAPGKPLVTDNSADNTGTDGLDPETRQEIEDAKREGAAAQREGAEARRQGELIRRRVLRDLKRNKMKPQMGPPRGVPNP